MYLSILPTESFRVFGSEPASCKRQVGQAAQLGDETRPNADMRRSNTHCKCRQNW